MQAIALAAASATIPIEKSKYRIRGFVDYEDFADKLNRPTSVTADNIKGIQVQYQYVNPKNESVGKADSFNHNGNNFLFSDWNELKTTLRPRIKLADGSYGPYRDNSAENEPSFNQFDIPITQGEEVNIKFRIVYDFGYPFIQMTSDWSDIITVEFPVELVQDVDVVDIISENNNDIETERFEKILNDNGITEHVNDKINDQDKIYFHNPDNIASGFYTEDSRRVIPLSDKLKEMSDNIARILGDVDNDISKTLKITVSFGDYSNVVITPNTINTVVFKDFKDFQNVKVKNFAPKSDDSTVEISVNQVGGYKYCRYKKTGTNWDKKDQFVETYCNLTLTNISDRIVKLFSLFPSTEDQLVSQLKHTVFSKTDHSGIYMKLLDTSTNDYKWTDQKSNQILTFRCNNPYDGSPYYDSSSDGFITGHSGEAQYFIPVVDDILSSYPGSNQNNPNCPYVDLINQNTTAVSGELIYSGTCVYPILDNDSLFMTTAEAFSYKVINPGESIIVPILVRYNITRESDFQVTKIMSFDIRTSLYEDPTNYIIKFVTGYNMTDRNIYGYTSSETGRHVYAPSVVQSQWNVNSINI